MAARRLQCWALFLSGFDCKSRIVKIIHHRQDLVSDKINFGIPNVANPVLTDTKFTRQESENNASNVRETGRDANRLLEK